MSETKRCGHCGQTLPLTAFYEIKRPSGLRTSGYCRTCTKARAVAWMKAQPPEWHAEKNKRDVARRSATPEARAKQAAAQRAWAHRVRETNPEKARATDRAHRERAKAKDPERVRARNGLANNHARAQRAGVESAFGMREWEATLAAFGKGCAYCGAPNCFLDMDHVVPFSAGGANVLGNVAPSCRPCNAQKFNRTLDVFAPVAHVPPARVAWIREVLAYLAAQREVA